ncbi:MAG: hypothetical protein K0R72_568 [Clostridia bacterium]|jgi:hypothetical protein|nr:hypothetical protein [Clostridia bacterium]
MEQKIKVSYIKFLNEILNIDQHSFAKLFDMSRTSLFTKLKSLNDNEYIEVKSSVINNIKYIFNISNIEEIENIKNTDKEILVNILKRITEVKSADVIDIIIGKNDLNISQKSELYDIYSMINSNIKNENFDFYKNLFNVIINERTNIKFIWIIKYFAKLNLILDYNDYDKDKENQQKAFEVLMYNMIKSSNTENLNNYNINEYNDFISEIEKNKENKNKIEEYVKIAVREQLEKGIKDIKDIDENEFYKRIKELMEDKK